jgi:glycosyltransferase involved in cell wall biosynthesis
LLRALAEVVPQLPAVHLHLVGDGPLRPDLERLTAQVGLAGRVTFHGAVAHDRLPDYYRAADLCVLASHYESQSLVVLEAAACARATVGTAVGLLPELAPPGWTVPPGDPGALAGALLTALADPLALDRAGRAARETVATHYSMERTLAILTGLYGELIPGSD